MIIALSHRALIRFSGPDARDLLDDLITASVPENSDDGMRPAALLTPQGRVLFDLLIGRDGDDILIEVDDSRSAEFTKKMMMYRLRRQVDISRDDRAVYAVIDDKCDGDALILRDTRFDGDVLRVYSVAAVAPDIESDDAWKAYRYRHGVAEGSAELPPEKALPLEARLDLNEGINFTKGCYIGQEVTARTRYRGLVKRCYLPVKLAEDVPTPHDISANGKLVGEVFDIVHTQDGIWGMAAIRLDALGGDVSLTVNDKEISVHYPERVMPLPDRKK